MLTYSCKHGKKYSFVDVWCLQYGEGIETIEEASYNEEGKSGKVYNMTFYERALLYMKLINYENNYILKKEGEMVK